MCWSRIRASQSSFIHGTCSHSFRIKTGTRITLKKYFLLVLSLGGSLFSGVSEPPACPYPLFSQPALFCTANTGKKACWLSPAEQGFFQGGEKNELFSSKHAYSWPFVSFDLGIRRLHECPYCHVMCTQCVNYWKWRGPGFIWERLQCWHAGEVGWNWKSPDAIYLSWRSHDLPPLL